MDSGGLTCIKQFHRGFQDEEAEGREEFLAEAPDDRILMPALTLEGVALATAAPPEAL